MATLKVFISSTCYDLGIVRSKLQEFFRFLGAEPVLSEHSDVLFDPRTHTHTSCVDEVANSDVMVLLVGARFGGKAVPEALSRVDVSKIKGTSASTWSLEEGRALSITQLEVLRAIELKQPLFVFVDERVMHDHLVYEKNKSKDILSEIVFPSVDKPESVQYIFEFINFLRLRNAGNAIIPFGRIDDIEAHLRKQWSALFQRLLREERTRSADGERAREIQQQLDELKTAILSSIQAPEAREIARGVIRYRRLIDFASALRLANKRETILGENLSWGRLMGAAGITRIVRLDQREASASGLRQTILVLQDGNYMMARWPFGILSDLVEDVASFAHAPLKVREAILEAWTETHLSGRTIIEGRGTLEEHLNRRRENATVVSYDPEDLTRPVDVREFVPNAAAEEGEDDDIPF